MLKVLVVRACLTLCDPMDYSPPGSSVHGILQARRPEWVTIPFSRGSPYPRIKPESPVLQADSLLSELPGYPTFLKPPCKIWNEILYVCQSLGKWSIPSLTNSSPSSPVKAILWVQLHSSKTKQSLKKGENIKRSRFQLTWPLIFV